MKQTSYDVAVIGGGPGGYAAALYCARSGFSVIVLEQLSPGGQMATTGQVDNYPGFEEGLTALNWERRCRKEPNVSVRRLRLSASNRQN